jgi:hypothetical protein
MAQQPSSSNSNSSSSSSGGGPSSTGNNTVDPKLSIEILAEEIRAAKDDTDPYKAPSEKRAKYIKEKLDRFTPEQLTRFEYYIQSHFHKSSVRGVMGRYLKDRKDELTDEMVIVVAGLAKLFVGEVMELAAADMRQEGSSNVDESHIGHAIEVLRSEGKYGSFSSHEDAFLFDS